MEVIQDDAGAPQANPADATSQQPAPQQPVDQSNPVADQGAMPTVNRELTFGEKAVGLSFNPSQNQDVEKIKKQYAALIDDLRDLRDHTSDPEVQRLASVAITEAQGAQMWAVKAVTWKS